mmetsp:Transcript_23612/g.42681  ORF Transcript_23612/g.42681 Transcript_23612/m.42681 type:complete len:507 (+) Transcript_23612:81-1601(+)|eukprot:CAMPEP_0197644714 /NCGR_PEP_ID=MMETSP1338-20131121/17598_1 /TAXON_ID=43686 ORGANISM="Pelagodinium beii, Strain RCC1491" /NCGR_SAMPLE_ID=MMETSP1338 /ASSEMBLY_ACC=CAM_ASM_000754 /LENGTH=506 /DNA_ID=CAMNT_0043218155 /DNA_START=71 /DNA_END=1591 /DNA_ORIENTATION=-
MADDKFSEEAIRKRRRNRGPPKPKPKSPAQLRNEAYELLMLGDCGGFWKNLLLSFKQQGINAAAEWKRRREVFSHLKKEKEVMAKEGTNHPFPRVRRLVMTTNFEIAGTLLIIGNTFFVGWQAGLMPWNLTATDELVGTILENFFTFCFSSELLLRTLTMGWPSLIAKENWLDVFLVFLGVLVTWILGPFGIQVELLRKLTALRTLRLVRVARSVRFMPEFKEMWALVKGLTESGETLFWVALMIGCVLYFFAIIATSLIGKADAFAEDELVQEYFGDVGKSMFTLYQLMTLDSWTGFARPMMENQLWTAVFFVIFIFVAVFVMLNLVTAVIVNNAFSDSKTQEKELALRKAREKEEELEDLKQFFLQIDLDGSGTLTRAELFQATKNRKVRNKLRALDVMPKDLNELWETLDDGNGELDAEEFVHGIRRLRGEAKAKDILRLYKELRRFETAVADVEGNIKSSEERMANIKAQMNRCRSDVAAFQRTMMRAKEAVKMAAQTQPMS